MGTDTGNESAIFREAAAHLMRGEGHRVWSLIVTIFGDLAQAPGQGISGAALSRLVGLMGVKPEAMRVALHRLRKDGWIESERAGRGSQHALTPYGRAQSAAASPRIYDRTRVFPETWHLLIAGSGEASGRGQLDSFLMTGDYLPIGQQVLLAPGPLPETPTGLMGVETGRRSVPGWLRDQVCPPAVMAQYAALDRDFASLSGVSDGADDLSLWERTALRLLIVHSWRRLLFRHPDLPEDFFPHGWPGPRCRERFCTLMEVLAAPSVDDIEAAP